MTDKLLGGRKHEAKDKMVMRHGRPELALPRGTHGVMQMPSDNLDVAMIQDRIRRTFFREEKNPGVGLHAEIHFQVVDNGDGTVEVQFEVQD